MRKFRSITSASDANLYVGPFGEIIVDNSNKLRLQDNVTPGGHLVVADTGNIKFVDSTLTTANTSNIIYVDSRRLAVTSEITVGNLFFTNNNVIVNTDAISITAGLHSMEFRDVSAGNLYINTGAVLKFDNVVNSDGPTFATWYGAEGDPFDPPGQHSLDIRAGSDSVNDYVEFASFDWDTYMGVTKLGAHVFTNWNADRTQVWRFNQAGQFVLPPTGIITSSAQGSNVVISNSNITLQATNQITSEPFALLIENSNFVFSGNVVPSGNVAYDLGTPTNQWRHLYVSSNTVYIGGTPLSVNNGELTVNGNPVVGGTSVPYLTVTNKALIVPPIAVGNETVFIAAEGSGAVDDIDINLGLSRGFGTDAKLFNVYSDYPSPVGTEWNSDGWADLTNLNLREYHSFSWATGFRIGNQVLTKNYIMRDIANNTFYKINFTVWQSGSNGVFTYVRQQVDPVTGADIGSPVTFEKTSNDGSFDAVSAEVHITRGGGGGIWNAVSETGWQDFYYNNRDVAPRGTAWNADGWGNLLDYTTREYLPFNDIYNSVPNIVGAELVMHDTVNNKYYKMSFSSWTTNGNAFTYTRGLLSNPAVFVKQNYGDQVDIFIPDDGNGAGIGIARGNNNGIYNPYREGGWNGSVSPAGTVWNIEGWDNLNNVTTRTYVNFYAAFGNGGLGNKVVGTECVMHIPENNTYYAIKFTSWTQNGNGGGFAYERYVIDTTKLPEGIAFPDGTVQKTAYNGGRLKSTASGGRKIEEVTGHNTVSVTQRITQPPASGTSYNTINNDWYIFFNWDTALANLYNGPGGYGFEISLDNNTWYQAQIVGSNGNTWLQVYLLNDRQVSVNTGDTIYYRVSTGGDPVIWWDYNTLPGGSANVRGAIIDYHAFTGDATIIGTIHIARDTGDDHITHTETSSGSSDSENDDLWNVVTEGQIRYRRMDGQAKTLKVQWIAKVFYGNEFWD